MKLDELFKNRRAIEDRLVPYGFVKTANGFQHMGELLDGQFKLVLDAGNQGQIDARVVDAATGEEYVLYRMAENENTFAGQVRKAYEAALTDVIDKCFEWDVFKSEQTRELIAYARHTYNNAPEYLWPKTPDNAIWRRKDNRKWYGAILTISRHKLGISSNEKVEILDLRATPDSLISLIDREKYYPGWHMNKKSWYTIILDYSVSTEELEHRLDESYRLAAKK